MSDDGSLASSVAESENVSSSSSDEDDEDNTAVAMNLNGVHPNVINAVNNLEEDEDDLQPQRVYVNLHMNLNETEALFVVGFLHGFLSQERSQESNEQQTGLMLGYYDHDAVFYSDQAMSVLCSYLQTTSTLPTLQLDSFPPAQYRQLLTALHTNTSVKELKLKGLPSNEENSCVTELLRHKADFATLSFAFNNNLEIRHLLPFLRQGPAILQNLEIDDCAIGDEDTHLLVEALVNNSNKYKNLKRLRLFNNGITSKGLRDVSRLDASILPSLECLNLGGNDNLLDDGESTQLFVQKLLLSKGTNVKELHVWSYCKHQAVGFTILIKSMEKNETLRLLNIISQSENFQPIRDQLLLSLSKMKGVQELYVGRGVLLDLDDQRIMMAFHQNVSIFKVRDEFDTWLSDGPRLEPIMKRNQQLVKLDALLGTTRTLATAGTIPNITTNITVTIPPPSGLWPIVLAKVGQGGEGGSPVFKILCNRLATWVVAAPTASTTTTTINVDVTNKKSDAHCPQTQIIELSKKRKHG